MVHQVRRTRKRICKKGFEKPQITYKVVSDYEATPATKELKGSADIILADRNVLERLLAPLRKVVNYEL